MWAQTRGPGKDDMMPTSFSADKLHSDTVVVVAAVL